MNLHEFMQGFWIDGVCELEGKLREKENCGGWFVREMIRVTSLPLG